MNATRDETDTRPPGTASMRAAAAWFLDQRTLPRHQSLELFSRDYSTFIEQLIPVIEQLAGPLAADDVPAQVALAGAAEARRRLHEPQAAGLNGEAERVKRLARSVVALCDHHDALTGRVMCLACDMPIEDGQPAVPYDHVSPSGGAARSGRIHALCANTVRR